MRKLMLGLFVLTAIGSVAAVAGDPPADADLPQVLIIGDSISIGYTPPLAEILKGEAIVEHNEGNAAYTANGLKKLDEWLGDSKWDVIHFNWGLHDLCYRDLKSGKPGNRDKVNGIVTTTLQQYEQNLEQLVTRLEQTGATLIWAQTTIVPEGEGGRIAGDEKNYNEVATRVMKKHNIMIDDLNVLTSGFSADLFAAPGNVHYKPEGYRKIAEQVAGEIRAALADKQPSVSGCVEPATQE